MKKLQLFLIVVGVVVIGVLFLGNKTTSYTLKMAQENKDVIDVHGKVTNMDSMERFYEKVNCGQAGKLRITRYNSEGEAIIYDINYNGEVIKCSVDRTRDSKAADSDRQVKNYQYKKLNIRKDDNVIEYYLTNSGCVELSILVTGNN